MRRRGRAIGTRSTELVTKTTGASGSAASLPRIAPGVEEPNPPPWAHRLRHVTPDRAVVRRAFRASRKTHGDATDRPKDRTAPEAADDAGRGYPRQMKARSAEFETEKQFVPPKVLAAEGAHAAVTPQAGQDLLALGEAMKLMLQQPVGRGHPARPQAGCEPEVVCIARRASDRPGHDHTRPSYAHKLVEHPATALGLDVLEDIERDRDVERIVGTGKRKRVTDNELVGMSAGARKCYSLAELAIERRNATVRPDPAVTPWAPLPTSNKSVGATSWMSGAIDENRATW